MVQNAKSFASAVKELVDETEIIYSVKKIEVYDKDKAFKKCFTVPGISKMHVISVDVYKVMQVLAHLFNRKVVQECLKSPWWKQMSFYHL